MFFRDIYKPIPSEYNFVLAMLWRHPENAKLDALKVVHYCAAVSNWLDIINRLTNKLLFIRWIIISNTN